MFFLMKHKISCLLGKAQLNCCLQFFFQNWGIDCFSSGLILKKGKYLSYVWDHCVMFCLLTGMLLPER